MYRNNTKTTKAMESYFKTPNLELIAKLVNLQLKMNDAYNTLQSVASETDSYKFDGEVITDVTTNENGVVTPRTVLHYIELYSIGHRGEKPTWAPKITKAAMAFSKMKKEYELLMKTEVVQAVQDNFPHKVDFLLNEYWY